MKTINLIKNIASLVIAILMFLSASANAITVTTYIHTDHLGSPVMATNEDSSVKWKEDYQPFGKQLIQTDPDNNIGFTGHMDDKGLGLTYMQGRWYNPDVGRFMALDPILYRDVHSFNRYAYANNNPFKYTDPNGQAAISAGVTAELVVGGGVNVNASFSFDTETLELGLTLGAGPRVGLSASIGVTGAIEKSGTTPASNSIKAGDISVTADAGIGPVSISKVLVSEGKNGIVSMGNSSAGISEALVEIKPQLKFGGSVGVNGSVKGTTSVIPDTINNIKNGIDHVVKETTKQLSVIREPFLKDNK